MVGCAANSEQVCSPIIVTTEKRVPVPSTLTAHVERPKWDGSTNGDLATRYGSCLATIDTANARLDDIKSYSDQAAAEGGTASKPRGGKK